MSIQSEITRISGNISDSLDAVAAKGVTIPSGANSDDLPGLIASIRQNGSAIVVTDVEDAIGGVHRTITGVTLGDDTVTPSKLATGITAHNALGEAITGTASLHDLSSDTVTPSKLAIGITAHNALGEAITGTASLHDLSSNIDWMGADPEHVGQVYRDKVFLKDTGFSTWTPSTTAKTIYASKNGNLIALDLENYEYWLVWSWQVDIVLNTEATKKAQIETQRGKLFTNVYRRPHGLSNIENLIDSYNYVTSIFTSSSLMVYWDTRGSQTWTTGLSYGFYPSNATSTVSSTSSLTPNLTPKAPSFSARCNSNYMAVARAPEINQEESSIIIVGDLYRVKKGSSPGGMFFRNAFELYANPLQ